MLVALIRGLTRRRGRTIGNFWVDLIRTTLRILVPIAFVAAIVLASQGVIQNFHASTTVTTVAGGTQTIPGGPVASQLAIKQLGTNGGGFFNTNSAHPFESPNGLTNMIEMFFIIMIPFGATYALGVLVKSKRFGWVIFGSMFLLMTLSIGVAVGAESHGNTQLNRAGVTQTVSATQPGGNMEGKEVRFGPSASGTWAGATTGSSNGSVNAFHDSFTPIGGLVPLTNLLLGEVTPGGLGVGLTGMLVLALLTVFIAGLMVGRTPEFLGKKIQAAEMKMVVLHILFAPLVILGFAAASVVMKSAVSSIFNGGPHGLSEVVYSFASSAGNNGSAFGGHHDEHQLVQHDDGHLDARRPVLLDHPDARDRGLARAQAGDPGERRHLPHGHAVVRRSAHGDRRDRRGLDLLPRPGARPDRRAPRGPLLRSR